MEDRGLFRWRSKLIVIKEGTPEETKTQKPLKAISH